MKTPITWYDEKRKLSELVPWTGNARESTPEQVNRIQGSLEEFGQVHPIAIGPDNEIYDGHQRTAAWSLAEQCGADGEVAVRVASRKLTEKEKQKLSVLLNEGAVGQWNFEAVKEWKIGMTELTDWGFEKAAQGADDEMKDAEPQIDKAEELNKKWKVRPGDLFHIDNHKLLCGDATKAEDVARVLDGQTPFLMVTDPPYGVEYDPTWRRDATISLNKNPLKMGKIKNDDQADWSDAWALFRGDVAYVYHGALKAGIVFESLAKCGFICRAQIIWVKDRLVLSRGDYHWQHEPCWYAIRKGNRSHRSKDRTQSSVWEIKSREDSGHGHGTQKPLECMARPIRNHDAQEIYDPFLGSGTTMIAAQNLGRKCYGIEISPAYCAVILQRAEDAFGITGERI